MTNSIPQADLTALEQEWLSNPRWRGVTRTYPAEQVFRLRGSMKIQFTVADRMARRLWHLVNSEPYVNALGAMTGNQAIQQVHAGLKTIYVSGWQLAGDANLACSM